MSFKNQKLGAEIRRKAVFRDRSVASSAFFASGFAAGSALTFRAKFLSPLEQNKNGRGVSFMANRMMPCANDGRPVAITQNLRDRSVKMLECTSNSGTYAQ